MNDRDDVEGAQRPQITRRGFLQRGGVLALAVFAPVGCRDSELPSVAVPLGKDQGAGFLEAPELETLRALVDRLIPPDDGAPGAAEAHCAEAIDALLAAFASDPPRIYAGAPFSDRGGSPINHFASFLPLDAYETLAWKLRIEGSQGRAELEFNGPIAGLQQVYREGLAALDAAAAQFGGTRYADLPLPAQELLLRNASGAAKALLDIAFPHTLQFMYGAPEYGGNHERAGWGFTNFEGDVQPRGYTAEEVTSPTAATATDLGNSDWSALAPLASPEVMHGLLARSDGRLSALAEEVRAALRAGAQRHV